MRRVVQPVRLLALARGRGCPRRARASRLTRAISFSAPPGSWKWCAATRQATTSKLESANGISSARLTTSASSRRRVDRDDLEPASRSTRATCPPPVATSSAVDPPPTRRRARGRVPRGARRSRGTPRLAPTRRRSCRELHRALGRVEHRRLDVDVLRRVPRRICRPPRRSCRRSGRRSDARSWSARAPARIPRATSSQRVIPPKMLKRIDFTCGSALMISSASTTPCASPPPPRSQKFAGCPPASAITSSVDMTRPAPLPRIPTSPSSFTYVTSFSRARAPRAGRPRGRASPRRRRACRARCRRP